MKADCQLTAEWTLSTENKNSLKLHEGSEVPAQLALKGTNLQSVSPKTVNVTAACLPAALQPASTPNPLSFSWCLIIAAVTAQ